MVCTSDQQCGLITFADASEVARDQSIQSHERFFEEIKCVTQIPSSHLSRDKKTDIQLRRKDLWRSSCL